MPQDPKQLKSILDSANVPDSIKAQTWDDFYSASNSAEFQSKFDKSTLPNSVKASLWDLKFPAPSAPQAPAPPQAQGGSPSLGPIQGTKQNPIPMNSPVEQSSEFWQNVDAKYNAALGFLNKKLNSPLSAQIGGMSLEDVRTQGPLAKYTNAPAGSGTITDALTVGAKLGAGVGDFIQSPAGIASLALAPETGGASVAAAYTAAAAPDAIRSAREAIKNPTPQNVQDAFLSAGMTVGIGAGAAESHPVVKPFESVVDSNTPRGGGAYVDPQTQQAAKKVDPKGGTKTAVPNEPATQYQPTKKASEMSAPRTIVPEQEAQSWQEELNRLKGIVSNPRATPDDLAYAQTKLNQLANDRENYRKPIGTASIDPAKEAALNPATAAIAPEIKAEPPTPKGPSLEAPEGADQAVKDKWPQLSEDVQRKVIAATERMKRMEAQQKTSAPDNAAARTSIESEGGVFRGAQEGLVHFDLPESMTGGRKWQSIALSSDNVSPESIRSAMSRKVAEMKPTWDAEDARAAELQKKEEVPPVPSEGLSPDEKNSANTSGLLAEMESEAKTPPKEPAGPYRPGLPEHVNSSLEAAESLQRQIEKAEDDGNKSLASRLGDSLNVAKKNVRSGLDSIKKNLGIDQLREQIGWHREVAERGNAQAKAMDERTRLHIQNSDAEKALVEAKRPGGPPKSVRTIDPDSGEPVVQKVKEEDKFQHWSRLLLTEFQGKEGLHAFDQIIPREKPSGMSAKDFEEAQAWRLNRRNQLKTEFVNELEMLKTSHPDEHEERIARIQELGNDLDEVSNQYGKAPLSQEAVNVGARPYKAAEFDERGAIKNDAPLTKWTLKDQEAAFAQELDHTADVRPRNFRQMKGLDELMDEADRRRNLAAMHTKIADEFSKEWDRRRASIEKQSGIVGELTRPKESATLSPADKDRITNGNDAIKRAKEVGIPSWRVTPEKAAGYTGWHLMDDKGTRWFIDSSKSMHSDVAKMLFPELEASGNAMKSMLEAGWVRQDFFGTKHRYEVSKLNNRVSELMERDMLDKRMFGQALEVDFRYQGDMKHMEIAPGWENLGSRLRESMRRRGFTAESGKVGGTPIVAGMAAGTLAGAKVGGVVGGPTGAVVGGVFGGILGAVTPAFYQTNTFRVAWKASNSIFKQAGVGVRDWIMGPKQDPSVLKDMDVIREKQLQDSLGSHIKVAQRIAQAPGDFWKAMVDRLAIINDRPGVIQRSLMAMDPRGQVFRDASGKLDVESSPYIAARLALGWAHGNIELVSADYQKIIKDSQQAKVGEHLQDYLNLKAYQRVHEVMAERRQEFDAQIQNFQTKLQSISLTPRQKIALEDDLREASQGKAELLKRQAQGQLTPAPYDNPQAIQKGLADLQSNLDPQKFAAVQTNARKVFDMNRKVLDLLHDNGIVGDEAYQKFTGRGNEYIPMSRIMSDVSDRELRRNSGKPTPLYLNQQNVIRALEGSDRVNRNPIVASAMANSTALYEVARNNVVKTLLKASTIEPSLKSIVRDVPDGYRARAGEAVIGHYSGGVSKNLAVPEWLAVSLEASPVHSDMGLNVALRFLKGIAQTTMTGGNVGFAMANSLKHFADMAIQSKAGLKLDYRPLKLMKDWVTSIKQTWERDPQYKEFMRSGAAFTGFQRAITPEHFVKIQDLGAKGKFGNGRVLDMVKDLNAGVENVTKFTAYKRLRASGMSDTAAAWETMNYGGGPDFSRFGEKSQAANLVSMFFNAHLAYNSRIFKRVAEEPAHMAVALAGLTALGMTLAAYNAQQKDDKGQPLMRRVPNYDRENNWVILTGDVDSMGRAGAYKIPKPSISKILVNPIEAVLGKLVGYEDRTGEQIGLNAISNVIPGQVHMEEGRVGKSAVQGAVSSLNPGLRIPIEQMTNSTSMGPIVPNRQQEIFQQYQAGPSTSSTAIRMGQGGVPGAIAGGTVGALSGEALGGHLGGVAGSLVGSAIGAAGVSPRRLDNVIKGTMGGVGSTVLSLSDPFFGGVQRSRQLAQQGDVRQTPLVGPLIGRFYGTSGNAVEQQRMTKYYDAIQQLGQVDKTYQYLQKNQPQEAQQFLLQHKDELFRYKIAQQIQEKVTETGKMLPMIQNNPNLDPQTRAKILQNIKDRQGLYMQAFSNLLDKMVQNKTGNTVGGNTSR